MNASFFITGLICLLLAFISAPSHAFDLFNLTDPRPTLILNAQGNYQKVNLFTDGSNSSYSGILYGGDLSYLMGDGDFSIGPYVSYTSGGLKNSANTSTRSETLNHTIMTGGLKSYIGRFFLRLGYSIYDIESKTTGSSNTTISMKGNGLEGELGLSWMLGESFVFSLGASVNSVSFSPGSSQVTKKTDYLGYGGFVSLGFVIPSGGSTPRSRGGSAKSLRF